MQDSMVALSPQERNLVGAVRAGLLHNKTTSEIAQAFALPTPRALRVLRSVVDGEMGQFEVDSAGVGVLIPDGRRFVCSAPSGPNEADRYLWFYD